MLFVEIRNKEVLRDTYIWGGGTKSFVNNHVLFAYMLFCIHLISYTHTLKYTFCKSGVKNIMPFRLGGKRFRHETEYDYLCHLQAVVSSSTRLGRRKHPYVVTFQRWRVCCSFACSLSFKKGLNSRKVQSTRLCLGAIR